MYTFLSPPPVPVCKLGCVVRWCSVNYGYLFLSGRRIALRVSPVMVYSDELHDGESRGNSSNFGMSVRFSLLLHPPCRCDNLKSSLLLEFLSYCGPEASCGMQNCLYR